MNSKPSSMPQDIIFGKIVCPASMRSSYWKYFGFPADSVGNIITRSKIICSICKAAIAYNKNTTNLRTHLLSKHPSIGQKLKVILVKKPKYVFVGETNKAVQETQIKREDSPFGDTEHLIETLTENEFINHQNQEIVENNKEFVNVEYLSNIGEDQNYEIEEIILPIDSNQQNIEANFNTKTEVDEKQAFEMVDVITDMIIDDLLPTNIVEGAGFQSLVAAQKKNSFVPNAITVEKELKRRYTKQYQSVILLLKTKLKDNNFSIGFELWSNVEQKLFISTFVTYIDEATLKTEVIGTVEPQSVDWSIYFDFLNMSKCSAAVINFDILHDEMLHHFLENNDVPIIPCFINVITHAVNRCFIIPSVNDAMKKATDFIHENTTQLTNTTQPPEIHENFWMTKYNYLEYFVKFIPTMCDSSDYYSCNLIVQIKSIINCLNPLKVTLDTLSTEKIATASLMKPLTQQLLDYHFAILETDTEIEMELKAIIQEEFEKSIISKQKLSIASFLDPRLQNLTKSDDLRYIKEEIRQLSRSEKDTVESSPMIEKINKDKQNTSKSGLLFFFKENKPKVTVNKNRDRFDVEFSTYLEDVSEELDQCPLSWWADSGFAYPNLNRVSKMFNCIPSFVQNHKLTLQQQIAFQNKRATLFGSNVNMLLWLHCNKTIT